MIMALQTQIIATISDERCDVEFIRALHQSGMTMIRLNTAHIDYDGFKRVVDNVRAASPQIGILIDTKGPEIRTSATRDNGEIFFSEGDKVTFSMKALGSEVASFDATYEIKDDTIAFDFDDEDVDNDWVKEAIEELEKPVSFEEGEDYIKIGGEKFTKKADK